MATMSKEVTPGFAAPATLPHDVTDQLLRDVDLIARRMTRQIADTGGLPPEFRRVGYLRAVYTACRDGLRTLVRLLQDGRGLRAGDLDRLGQMGAEQAEMGVPLELLLSAYRLAAKVVWREVMGAATQIRELPPATVIAVTENVLEYLDEISGAVGAAYLATRERLMRERDRNRDRVLQRLLAGDASPELRNLAALSDIDLTPPYRAVAYAAGDGEEIDLDPVDAVWRRVRAHTVSDASGAWIALVPAAADPVAICTEIRRRNRGGALAFGIGPVAPTLGDVADSASRARSALRLGARLEPEKAVHSDDDLGIFAVIERDPEAIRRFAARVLGPLALNDQPRHRELLATLEALLNHTSSTEAATALGIHRHTIVYRVRGLRELGVDPDSPAARPRIWLALRALRLIDPAAGG